MAVAIAMAVLVGAMIFGGIAYGLYLLALRVYRAGVSVKNWFIK